jgi:O-antigen/teichoic acid export membrane protein
MATSAAVGRYGAAYRLIDSTLFITFSLNTAFAPMYAYLGSDTTPTIQSLFQRSIKLALALLVPCAIAFALLAEPLCRLLFGPDFADAAPALRLLAPVAVGVAIVNLCSTLVVSRRNPRTMVLATVPMVAFNVVLNVVLIPRWVESGSAAAMLVTETGFVVVALVLAAYTVRPIHWLRMTGPPLLAGAVMVAPVLLLAPSLVPALAAGGAVYVAAYLAFERLISPVDLAFIAGLARRLAGRVRGMVGAAAP